MLCIIETSQCDCVGLLGESHRIQHNFPIDVFRSIFSCEFMFVFIHFLVFSFVGLVVVLFLAVWPNGCESNIFFFTGSVLRESRYCTSPVSGARRCNAVIEITAIGAEVRNTPISVI